MQQTWKSWLFKITLIGAFLIFVFQYTTWSAELFPSIVSNTGDKVVAAGETTTGQEIKRGGDVVVPPPHIGPTLKPDAASSTPPEAFTAQSIIVKDRESGTVLYKKDEYGKRPLASITKLMTGLVLLDLDIHWASSTKTSEETVFDTLVLGGKEYTLEDLWSAAFIGSSNQAILGLVDAVIGDRNEAIFEMNAKARLLGMTDTVFVDPTGLDQGNVSTAADVALLLPEALQHDRIHTSVLQREFTVATADGENSHHMWNTDWLLLGWIPHSFAEFHGGKTGYIPDAGYNFTMEVANAEGHAIEVVVLGAETHEARFTEARDVAKWVFQNYEWLSP